MKNWLFLKSICINRVKHEKVVLKHKKARKGVVQSCQICEYKTIHKQHLEKHYIPNHFSEELKTICKQISRDLKCTLCEYIAKTKAGMTCHVGIQHGYINKILMANGYKIIAKKKK